MWFMPFEEKGTIIRSVYKPSCNNNGTGSYDTTTMGSGDSRRGCRSWDVNEIIYINKKGMNCFMKYIS